MFFLSFFLSWLTGELKAKCTKSDEKKEKLEVDLEKLQDDMDKKAAEMSVLQTSHDNIKSVLAKVKEIFRDMSAEIESLDSPLQPVKKEKKWWSQDNIHA